MRADRDGEEQGEESDPKIAHIDLPGELRVTWTGCEAARDGCGAVLEPWNISVGRPGREGKAGGKPAPNPPCCIEVCKCAPKVVNLPARPYARRVNAKKGLKTQLHRPGGQLE